MSLAITLTNALSGLAVNQAGLQVTSNNVANANTEGYSRKSAIQESRLLDGIGAGVQISAIERSVDEFLLREVRREASALGESSVRREFYERMQSLFGTLGDDSSVGAAITRFSTALETVATNPETAAHRLDAVNAGAAAARELNGLAERVQELRGEANREIAAAVESINLNLQTIAELNVRISNLQRTGKPTGDLEDLRDQAVDAVAELMPIQYFERSNGHLVVLTPSGQALVEARAAKLSYAPAAIVTADHRYLPPSDPGYPGMLPGIILNPSDPPNPLGDGARDLTGAITTGTLAGLIEMRDTALPDLAAQFDELASRLRDRINAVHNAGVAYPGADRLTGSVALPAGAATPITGTGTVRIGTVDANGDLNTPRLDLDLSTVTSVGDIVTAINGTAGLNIAASVDSAGQLVLAAATADRIVVADPEPPSPLTPSAIDLAGGTRGFSHFFGLNNFFTTAPELSAYAGKVVTAATTVAAAGTLTFETASGTFTAAYSTGMRLDEVARAINAGLAGQGVTATARQVTGGLRLELKGPNGAEFLVRDSGTLLSTLDLRPGVDNSARDLAVRDALVQRPDLLSRGKLQEEPAGSGNFHIGSADDSTARALAGVFAETINFGALGGLPATDDTLGGYGTTIASFNASNAAAAEADFAFQDSLHGNLRDKALSFSGVNVDEEMARMVLFQNAYQASARLVQAADELFDILVNLGG